ncbi:MAG TPA: hypothetical protein VIZ62_07405 [Nitrososphaeraceae archaeon]
MLQTQAQSMRKVAITVASLSRLYSLYSLATAVRDALMILVNV